MDTTSTDPLISADELRLAMGELTSQEVRIAQAAYRLGVYNTKKIQEEQETLAKLSSLMVK